MKTLLLISAFAVISYGHYVGIVPDPRPGSGPSTTAPCGNRPSATGAPITTLQPNSYVNVSWRIQQSHNEMTTVSILGEVGNPSVTCVLLNRAPNIASGSGKELIVSVYIPNVQCTNCVLQIKNRNWYSCHQVKIAGTTPIASATCRQPCAWPYWNYTARVQTVDPRWTPIETNNIGRAKYFLDIYGKPPAFPPNGNQPQNTLPACTMPAQTTVATGGVMPNGQINIGAGAAIAKSARLTLGSELIIHESTRTTNSVQMKIEGPSNKWFGVGFGTAMIGSDAIIWSSGGANQANNLRLEDYKLNGKTTQQVVKDTSQDWVLISQQTVGTKTTLTAQRLVNTGDTNDVVLNAMTTPVIWAVGTTANNYQLRQHGGTTADRGSGTTITWTTVQNPVSPGTGGNSTTAGPTNSSTNGGGSGVSPQSELVAKGFGVYGAELGTSSDSTSAHGFFMGCAWAILIPAAIIINRYRDQFAFLKTEYRHQELWFHLHRGFMITAFLFMLIGWFVKLGELRGMTNSFHSVLGMMLIIFSAFSIIAGFLRPDEFAPRRPQWLMVHRYAGFTYLVIAFIQVSIGLSIGGASVGSILTFVFWVLILLGVAAFFERRRMNGAGAKDNSKNIRASIDMREQKSDHIVAVDDGEGYAPTSVKSQAFSSPARTGSGGRFPPPPVPGPSGGPPPPPYSGPSGGPPPPPNGGHRRPPPPR